MHLSVMVKEIQAGYLSSSYFKDIYLYLSLNRFSLSLYVPYPMMWAIMDFHSSLSLAISNSATSWYLTPLSPIHSFKFAIQSDHFLPLLLFPSMSMPDCPNHLFSSNVPDTSSALFLFLRLVSCLFQLFSKPLHFLLCLSKES